MPSLLSPENGICVCTPIYFLKKKTRKESKYPRKQPKQKGKKERNVVSTKRKYNFFINTKKNISSRYGWKKLTRLKPRYKDP
jgi:hypothetical protein